MRHPRRLRPVCLLGFCLLWLAGVASAAPLRAGGAPRAVDEPTDRIIVKWRPTPADLSGAMAESDVRRLEGSVGTKLNRLRSLGGGLHLLRLDTARSPAQLDALLGSLRRNPQVLLAEADRRVHAHAYTPNDPLFAGQWYLQAQQVAAIRANTAWDLSKGGVSAATATVVVAVIDTGVRFEHPDLRAVANGGKLLPGYDFVSADKAGVYATANDGDGWDADASDPGDFLSAADLAGDTFSGKQCGSGSNQDQPTRSSWHGTRVAGLIAADTDNATGIAGAGFHLRILPARVLGKCGGYDSDVLAAMYWSAGLSIPLPLLSGAPTANANPAQVINLSLGGAGSCNAAYSEAVRDITAHGVLIVASAGNDGGPVDSPANCPGVLAVGGLRHAGTKVGYSNLGPEVALGAPAGNCVLTGANDPCLFSLDTTTDSGTQGPVSSTYTNSVNSNVGTSFSAPLAAATAGLMRALNPRLTPSQLIARLRSSAAAFPTTSDSTPAPPVCHTPAAKTDVQDAECLCTTAVCGAGLLNAGAALIEAQRPAAVAGVSGSVGTGRPLTLDGSGSGAAQGRSIASYTWSVVSTAGGASTPAFSNPNVATTTVLSPTSGSYTLRLTVTDSAGTSDSAELSVTAATSGGTTTSTAAPPASGSGGGGALSLELLALAALVTQRRRWQRGSHPARA